MIRTLTLVCQTCRTPMATYTDRDLGPSGWRGPGFREVPIQDQKLRDGQAPHVVFEFVCRSPTCPKPSTPMWGLGLLTEATERAMGWMADHALEHLEVREHEPQPDAPSLGRFVQESRDEALLDLQRAELYAALADNQPHLAEAAYWDAWHARRVLSITDD